VRRMIREMSPKENFDVSALLINDKVLKSKESGLFKGLNTPSIILFKKTLFKDIVTIPKVSISIIIMSLIPLLVILMTPKDFISTDETLLDFIGITYTEYTYCIMFPIILTVIGAPLIAEELKSRTMLTLISKPISRGEILATKYIALTCFGLVINFASLSLITLTALWKYPFEGIGEFFVTNLLFSLVVQFFFQTLAIGFSSLVRKTRNALLFPLLLIIITFFVLMTFRPLFFYIYIGDSEDPIYVQFQLYHFDLGYHLFNAYIGIMEITSVNVPESMKFFFTLMGIYTQSYNEDTWEPIFTRNDYYSPLGSLILLFAIALGIMLLGYFIFRRRDISR
jgi:ABC-type transport system involved in multi-copper enzyme maturation permease subunit